MKLYATAYISKILIKSQFWKRVDYGVNSPRQDVAALSQITEAVDVRRFSAAGHTMTPARDKSVLYYLVSRRDYQTVCTVTH